ncbi:MAG: aminotransferase class I/II-fold pyridoxal phosphate-dependent enzyme [Actinobacteria bacterium]|nr:aminotransferase class I/II-fold pyridoxal phosphate-dependent enzyme [Actinomycetota bacterium]
MSDDIHGGKIREAATALGIPGDELLDFSANVNFLGPSPRVVAAARRAVGEMGWYPLDPPDPLRRAAAGFLGVPQERVALGNGASELIFLTVAHLRPRRVVVLGPTFTEYERAARAWGAEVDLVFAPEERDFAFSEEHIEALAPRLAAADLVFICDPNNPTGDLWDRRARDTLISICARAGTAVFVDESFLAFTEVWPGGAVLRRSVSSSEGSSEQVIVLHSLTKILTMPGLRVGALVLPEALADGFLPRVPPWNVNCIAQAAAVAGLEDVELLERTPPAVTEARIAAIARLRGIPGVARVLPAAANFLCLRLAAPGAREVAGRLRQQHGILVRDLTDFPGMGARFLRVAVREPADNDRLIKALAEVLAGIAADAFAGASVATDCSLGIGAAS